MLGRAAQNRMLASLGPLGEHYFANAEQLRKSGFCSFEALLQFEESFCATPEAQQLRRQIAVEAAKETIGNASPYYYKSDETPQGYLSLFLEHLRHERTARGEAFALRDPLKPWLVELDYCKRAELECAYTRHAEFKARKSAYVDEERRLRQLEGDFHATALSRQLDPATFEKPVRVNLCKEVLAQAMGPHGFAQDRKRSSRSAIVFSKPLVADWALSWVIDPTNLFSPVGTRLEDQIGFLDIDFELRHSSVKGLQFHDESHQGHCIPVRYDAAAPFAREHNGKVYSRFTSPPELETALRAHLFFYTLIAEKVEQALASGLTSELNLSSDRVP